MGQWDPRDKNSSKSNDASDHDLAEMESRDCAYCGGSGMALVYAPQHDGTGLYRRGDETPFPTVICAYCCCSLGRWTRNQNKQDIYHPVPLVQNILDGNSRWMLENPTEDSVENPNERVTADDFLRFWDRIRHRGVVKHIPGSPTRTTASQIASALASRRERERSKS